MWFAGADAPTVDVRRVRRPGEGVVEVRVVSGLGPRGRLALVGLLAVGAAGAVLALLEQQPADVAILILLVAVVLLGVEARLTQSASVRRQQQLADEVQALAGRVAALRERLEDLDTALAEQGGETRQHLRADLDRSRAAVASEHERTLRALRQQVATTAGRFDWLARRLDAAPGVGSNGRTGSDGAEDGRA